MHMVCEKIMQVFSAHFITDAHTALIALNIAKHYIHFYLHFTVSPYCSKFAVHIILDI